MSITSTNGNRPKACFSNTIKPYFSRVCKVFRTDKLRYRVQPTASCRALLSTRRASALTCNDMGLILILRTGTRTKIRKAKYPIDSRNYRLLVFILRLPRYSLTFGLPWTRPSVHSPVYQWNNCTSNITRILKHYFDSETLRFDEVCLHALLTFFFTHTSWDEVWYAN